MTKTRLIGDIHGRVSDYFDVAKADGWTGPTIQVGDFGVGFLSEFMIDMVNENYRNGKHRFIRGNHDNPEMCKNEMVGYIPDGFVKNDVMFIGGAYSIDYARRTPGVSWWYDEELSQNELDTLFSVHSLTEPRVMITHDAPSYITNKMFLESGEGLMGSSKQYLTRTGEALQRMFEHHQPEEWYFGHWHITKSADFFGTKFQCLGELDYVDVNL